MEKILRQSILRRNQLLKKARKTDLKELRSEWREFNQHRQAQAKVMQRYIVGERKARREDWLSGSLAPNRDAGEVNGTYGAVNHILQARPKLPKRYLQGPKGKGSDATGSEDPKRFEGGEWYGEGICGNVAPGDRVAVVNGRPGVKGMIGQIFRVEPEAQAVWIRNVNKVDIQVPAFMGLKEKLNANELSIPMSDIRLVMPMKDPDRGIHRDYIVKDIYGGAPYLQRSPGSNLPRHTRYITGLDQEIPWPEEDVERQYAKEGDTTSLELDVESYIPSLMLTDQLPQAIGELRSKYSRTRKSHDDIEWVKHKVLEDARNSWLEQRKGLMFGGNPQVRSHGNSREADAEGRQRLKHLVQEVQRRSLTKNQMIISTEV